jgi:hypothetical protein
VPIAPQPTGSTTFSSPQSPPPPFSAIPTQHSQYPLQQPSPSARGLQQQNPPPVEKGAGVQYGQDVPGDLSRIGPQELPAADVAGQTKPPAQG